MKTLPISILILLTLPCFSQSTIMIEEDFSSNARHWELSERTSVSNGTLIIRSEATENESVTNVFIEPQKDFLLTADFVQQGGTEDAAFGLLWGTGDEDYNLFVISSSQDFIAYSGNPAHMKGWMNGGSIPVTIQPIGQPNKLKVHQIADKITFHINDVKVDEQKAFPLFGNWMGFIVLGEAIVSVDNFKFLQDQAIDLPKNFLAHKKENLGAAVNSKDDDLGPMISADGKMLFFARQNVRENIGGFSDGEDVWFSRFDVSGWTAARNMGPSVNTSGADNLVAISTDNNTMMFIEENQLALRHRTESGWSPLEKLNLSFKNESNHFVASLTADGKAIIFSAKLHTNIYYNKKRDECDLYVCLKLNDHEWSQPINLGSTINSAGNETSPFLSADGTTLYFATDGRPGYGDQDIFFSTRRGSGWTDWTAPVNLGPAVNTPGFEAYYTVPASHDYAYFVSNDGNQKDDIWRIRLHDDVKPKPVTLVTGAILEKGTRKPLGAKINFENLSTGKMVGEARSDPKTGSYQIVLPSGVHYGVHAVLSGYYSLHENLDLKQTTGYSELKKDLMMAPFNVGESIKLNNVFFEAGVAVLRPESYHELDRLVSILKDNPSIHIELEGHTDSKGDKATLLKLSQERVEAVKAYLTKQGIHGGRISGKGYGASRPVAPSDTEENSSLNRRVEFKITKA